jgi:plastocyanin
MHPPKLNKMKQTWVGWGLLALPCLGLVLLAGWLAQPPREAPASRTQYAVSQRGREFMPGRLDVRQGDIVHIINDDGDLSHHAYVASDRFKFDSGDQEPGHDVDIPFTVAGTFNVLCGIHPKMRLTVNVR